MYTRFIIMALVCVSSLTNKLQCTPVFRHARHKVFTPCRSHYCMLTVMWMTHQIRQALLPSLVCSTIAHQCMESRVYLNAMCMQATQCTITSVKYSRVSLLKLKQAWWRTSSKSSPWLHQSISSINEALLYLWAPCTPFLHGPGQSSVS